MKQQMIKAERFFLFLLGAFLLAAFYLHFFEPSVYLENFINEDGIVENTTAFSLFFVAMLQCVRWIKCHKHKPFWWKIGVAFSSLIFLFGAGEEISWGQRIFNLNSTYFFLENNVQGETNLHNLTINGVKINKLIFGKLMSAALLIYFLALPLLYQKWEDFKGFVDAWAIPIPEKRHIVIFAVSVALIFIIGVAKPSELMELTFAMTFAAIFLQAKNRFVFE